MVQLTFSLKRVSVGIVIIIVQLFLLVNASWIYGETAPQMEKILTMYLIMQAVILAAFAVRMPQLERFRQESAFKGLIVFLGASLILVGVPATIHLFLGGLFSEIKIIAGFGLVHGFVIAYTEELIFRHILPKVAMLGDIMSSTLFGVFHIAVYHTTPLAMILLMALGFGFALIRDRFGMMGAVGAHVAWNWKVLGVLDKIFLGL